MESQNNITNSTSSHGSMENPYLVQQVVFELFLFFLIVFGNGAVLLVIIIGSQTSRMHFFIKNLAFADLCTGFLYLLPRIVLQLSKHVFYGGNVLCKIYEYFSHVVVFGSNFIMIALSIDRLFVVAYPVRSLQSMGRKSKLGVLACWALACVLGIMGPVIYQYNETYRGCYLTLATDYEFKVYFVVIFVFQFVIPALVIGGCYVTIAIIVWKVSRKTKIIRSVADPESLDMQEKGHISLRRHTSGTDSMEHNISSTKMRTIKIISVITLAYVCCWTPYMIFNLLDVHGYFSHDGEMPYIRFFMQSLLPLNSAVNPMIYGFFSSSICSQFKVGLRKKLSITRKTENDTV